MNSKIPTHFFFRFFKWISFSLLIFSIVNKSLNNTKYKKIREMYLVSN